MVSCMNFKLFYKRALKLYNITVFAAWQHVVLVKNVFLFRFTHSLLSTPVFSLHLLQRDFP